MNKKLFCNNFDLIFREFYKKNQSRADLKVTDPDEPNSQYFATNVWGDWQRVEPMDTRMGESLRVNIQKLKILFVVIDIN